MSQYFYRSEPDYSVSRIKHEITLFWLLGNLMIIKPVILETYQTLTTTKFNYLGGILKIYLYPVKFQFTISLYKWMCAISLCLLATVFTNKIMKSIAFRSKWGCCLKRPDVFYYVHSIPTKICILLKLGKRNVVTKIQKHLHFNIEEDGFLNGTRGQMIRNLEGVIMTYTTFRSFFKIGLLITREIVS